MDVLLTLAILRKIAFASSVLPFTINHRTDSGVRLNKQKEMFSSVLVQSLFSKDIKSPSLVDRGVSVVITLIIISLNGWFLLSHYLVSSRIAPSPSPPTAASITASFLFLCFECVGPPRIQNLSVATITACLLGEGALCVTRPNNAF